MIKENLPNQEKDCSRCIECCEPSWKGWIRPFGFIVTLFIFFLLIFIDGNWHNFHVRDAYLPILETVLVTIVIAFFGSRGVEKTAREIKSQPPIIKDKDIPDIYRRNSK
jgi:hypothetical protein